MKCANNVGNAAGKGRSGTMSCAYLISEHGYTAKQAMDQFTKYRMRPGFGEGVSIPSQVRYCHYVESWVRDHHKRYVDRSIRINELHVFGLRSGVKVAIQGYQDGGKVIKTFHTFHHDEKTIVARRTETGEELKLKSDAASTASSSSSSSDDDDPKKAKEKGGKDHEGVADVIFRPKNLLVVPNNDINIDFERRTKPKYGLALVTSIGHVWFNTYFEAAKRGEVDDSGVFEIEWGKMDGVKGTYKKGVKALDRLKVVWSVVEEEGEREVKEPELGEEVKLNTPAKNKKMVEEERGVGNVVESSGESSMTPAPNGETSSLDGAGGREQPYEAKVSRLGSIKREKGDNGKASSIH